MTMTMTMMNEDKDKPDKPDDSFFELHSRFHKILSANRNLSPWDAWVKMAVDDYGILDDPVLVRDAWLEYQDTKKEWFAKQGKRYKKKKKKRK